MRLIPRDQHFFELFGDIAQRLTTSARLLSQLFAEPARIDHFVTAIKAAEHEADALIYEVNQRIDRSFVTPLDREDIHLLATRLDNVVDLIDGVARRVAIFQIREVRDPAARMADVIVRATDAIAASVTGMKQPKIVGERAREIKKLEEEGDALYHQAIAMLFSGSLDALEVIKWKEIFDKLEDTLDECEDVANVLESISIKNS